MGFSPVFIDKAIKLIFCAKKPTNNNNNFNVYEQIYRTMNSLKIGIVRVRQCMKCLLDGMVYHVLMSKVSTMWSQLKKINTYKWKKLKAAASLPNPEQCLIQTQCKYYSYPVVSNVSKALNGFMYVL